jgi:hypothetical protein
LEGTEMNGQPKALRLAEWLECGPCRAGDTAVAAELRRLHELNQALIQALNDIAEESTDAGAVACACDALAKAKGQA